ncbi:proline-specific peptidase [Armillaria borealis]|uniref:Proline-specific peptidase n=1 Tax=Armillaria borealis TaxID=47425 RepID=A0AA39K1A4_9AGAR|nr:proline-specific peptidase [Armillaria borealis]
MSITEGTIPFTVNGEAFHTWYKIAGDITSSRRPPLIILHGGPGGSHDYMLPLVDLSTRDPPTTIIFYDQIGTGHSSHIHNKPSSFWSIELFVNELENLIAHFSLTDKSYDLLGQSWGAQLGAEFIIRRQPHGLRRLILANGLASAKLRNEARWKLMAKLPPEVGETIKRHEREGSTLAEEYKAAWRVFYENYACRMKPIPAEVIHTIGQTEDDDGGAIVLDNMRKNVLEFEWDIIDKIHLIRVPTLIINGEYDYMTDEVCAPFFWRIDKVKWVKFAHSSHMPQWEERERYIDVVDEFLGQA